MPDGVSAWKLRASYQCEADLRSSIGLVRDGRRREPEPQTEIDTRAAPP